MSLLIAILVILIILALVLWALSLIPVPSPINWILQLLAVLVAILLIVQKAGLA